MTLLEEVRTFLNAIGSLGTIKIGTMPETPDAVCCLYEYGGKDPVGRFGVTGIGYENPAIQVVFRGDPEDYIAPRVKADTAWKALAAFQPGALGSGVTTVYLTIQPKQSPFLLEPGDRNKRIKIACNFYIMKEPS